MEMVNRVIFLNEFAFYILLIQIYGGAHGVMVIILGNGHGDMSSNPGRDWLHFT